MSSPVSQNVKLAASDLDRKSPLEKYAQVRKLNDPRFGEVQILQSPLGKEYIAAQELKFTDEKSVSAAVVAARKRLNLKHPNLVGLLDYSVSKQSELCSTFYILRLFYDYPKTDLKKEGTDRGKQGGHFSAQELLAFFQQQSEALDYLHAQGTFHGDVQPLLIGFNRDSGQTKLIDKPDLNTPDKLRASQKNRFVSGQPLYVSPATYASLAKGNANYPVDPVKEDSYGLGLSILELGNQRSVQDVYDKNTKSINKAAFNAHIEEFNRSYGASPQLVESVVGLTNLDEENRVQTSQVTQYLINGQNLHTVVTTRVEALPMDGIGLYDGIDTNFNAPAESVHALPVEAKVHAVHAQAEVVPSSEKVINDNERHLVNLDELNLPSHKVETTVYSAPPVEETRVVYQQPTTSVVYQTQSPNVIYSSSSPSPTYQYVNQPTTVYSTLPESYTTTYVTAQPHVTYSSVPVETVVTQAPVAQHNVVYSSLPATSNVVYNQTNISTEPVVISSNVTTQVISDPVQISGLKLVRTYEDYSKAKN